ncbi:MAG: aminotransferase class V-fold PLP-dependent enzyme [Acidiferrobacterales bacterium]|nr:aminotransferase class V-fold PLP-dependent enzyme [Acidiferrobacterales bacterium]
MSKTVSTLEFVGLDTIYPNVEGQSIQRLHLDGAASPLACKASLEAYQTLLPHYSNSHSYVHNSAQISTKALAWAHQTVLKFVNASTQTYASIFSGSGTTAAINRVARGLHAMRPDKPIVLISAMEHHANDLPHRQFGNEIRHIPLTGTGTQLGAVNLNALEALLKEFHGRVNYVAVSSVSNVTGISNPIEEMVKLAHNYDALLVVDAAQSVAHSPSNLDKLNADFFIFSGHKVYSPGAPGVLLAKKELLAKMHGQDLGGGSVTTVSYFDYELAADYPTREQSGTPNIAGAVGLANVLKALSTAGMKSIQAQEDALMAYMFDELNSIQAITVYGDHLLARSGALAFNHQRIDHGLLAAILNDYHGIAVRNECFCAHPYVSSLLKEELWDLDLEGVSEAEQEAYINRKRGMVRASVSAYNTKEDVVRLVEAIKLIESRVDDLRASYVPQDDGSYIHRDYKLDWQDHLDLNFSADSRD